MKNSKKDTKAKSGGKKPQNTARNTIKEIHRQKNTPKQQSAPKEKTTNKTKNKSNGQAFINFIKARETHTAFGIFLILFSIYLLFAFFSYLKNWQTDDNAVQSGLSIIFDSSVTIQNGMGKLGAILGYIFVKQWFGIGAFLMLIFFTNSGLLLLRIKIISFFESILYLLGTTLWLSVFMSAIFTRPDAMIWGGLFGQQIRLWLSSVVGNFGLVVLLLLVFVIYVAALFGFKLHEIKLRKWPTSEKKEADSEETDSKKLIIDDVYTHEKEIDPVKIENEKMVVEHEFERHEKDVIAVDEEKVDLNKANDINFDLSEEIHTNKEYKNADQNVDFVIESQIHQQSNEKIEETDVETAHYGINTLFDPLLELSQYKIPPTSLLIDRGDGESKVSREELEHNKNRIVETLANYDIKISKIKATIGPTVTMYEIVPAPGVRISRIKNLEDDIALSLAALGIRIIAPIPGKGTIGIEVPNQQRETVSLRSLLESERFTETSAELPFAMGKTITNEPFVADLAKLPHLLIAGATGQGKSVGLNAIICSLLYKKHPSQLKFVFVDPKKVELAMYSRIDKHFLAKLPDEEEAIITDVNKVISTLTSLTQLMDSRYDLLKNAGTKNIIEYNRKFTERKLNPENGNHYMPYVVLVIDEFADLIMTAGKEVELPVARIAQLARAVGIHLIVATQRPSVDVITGKIKANFPARIAFKVSSKVDSRTILDSNGADQLIGQGDMLYSHGSTVLRLQCAFVDTPEIEDITNFIGDQQGYSSAFELPEPVNQNDGTGKDTDLKTVDKLFSDAARIVVMTGQGSTSLLQTKLTIGFARARRIIEQLEMAGIVGPPQGSKPRDVLVGNLELLEQFLKNLE
ncbi:MAG: cell division protein FtsK [Bacteroidetes bacterium HGW-Bacteroidetes-6]|nr:MAG: cell division protein FtsK [Bacteroidetes bacterium HGW-Bacteroidetes-6]